MSNSSSAGHQWALLLVLTALLLSLAVLSQQATRLATAWLAAPREVVAILDAVDSSVAENESYDRDVTRLRRLEDKLRLGRLLREVQSAGDDLRESLNALLLAPSPGDAARGAGSRLRLGARLLWAVRKAELEERIRRLDLLRMRFLVVYMGIVASGGANPSDSPATANTNSLAGRDPEKGALRQQPAADDIPRPPPMPRSLTDNIKIKPPLRRLTTQAIGHHENVDGGRRTGWLGVVQELKLSPRMHKRHASIEGAMAASPKSPE